MEHLPDTIDKSSQKRARLGVIVLQTDYNLEEEFMRVIVKFEGVALHFSKILFTGEGTAESLASMAPRITESAAMLLSTEPFQAIAYGCTSATSVIGEERVRNLVQAAKPEA